jgi:hypothetical protein
MDKTRMHRYQMAKQLYGLYWPVGTIIVSTDLKPHVAPVASQAAPTAIFPASRFRKWKLFRRP